MLLIVVWVIGNVIGSHLEIVRRRVMRLDIVGVVIGILIEVIGKGEAPLTGGIDAIRWYRACGDLVRVGSVLLLIVILGLGILLLSLLLAVGSLTAALWVSLLVIKGGVGRSSKVDGLLLLCLVPVTITMAMLVVLDSAC